MFSSLTMTHLSDAHFHDHVQMRRQLRQARCQSAQHLSSNSESDKIINLREHDDLQEVQVVAYYNSKRSHSSDEFKRHYDY